MLSDRKQLRIPLQQHQSDLRIQLSNDAIRFVEEKSKDKDNYETVQESEGQIIKTRFSEN
jgi:hypothetical protein